MPTLQSARPRPARVDGPRPVPGSALTRLREAGLAAFEERDTSCCYALQDKEPWEVYVVKADADTPDQADAGCACGD
ncbi:hypothetical protein M2164_007428 [Streptomyces sp. SAI-208]|nr:hypothetical protein [Streptomyces sp. SAI-208]